MITRRTYLTNIRIVKDGMDSCTKVGCLLGVQCIVSVC